MRRLKYFLLILCAAISLAPKPAKACCLCSVTVVTFSGHEWLKPEDGTFWRIVNHVESELSAQRVWWGSIIWEDNVLPALMLMAEQFTVVAIQQAQIYGTFLDAKHQLETQQLLSKIRLQAHKDYHPSTGMCELGSTVKSLAASERKSEYNAVLLSKRAQDRAMGSANTAAATGDAADKRSRLTQFVNTFCDPADSNNNLRLLCQTANTPEDRIDGAEDPLRRNKDIDYVRTLEAPWSLDVNFTDNELTPGEEDVLALASNLYGHDIFLRPPAASLQTTKEGEITPMQQLYMDMRSIQAKRSVAQNSFNALVSMKSEGAPGSKDFLRAVLRELGYDGGPRDECIPGLGFTCDPNDLIGDFFGLDEPLDIPVLLGENPSYYAQMEVLTKKIFQNPDFYTNLYDKPANVERKGVALQAIGLMQKFDLFKSYLRNEANLSVLLELSVNELQDEIENEISEAKNVGATLN